MSQVDDTGDRYLPFFFNSQTKTFFSPKINQIWGVHIRIWTTDGDVRRRILRRESDTNTTKNNKNHAGLFVVVFTPKQQQRVGREGGKGEEDETKGGVKSWRKTSCGD